MAIGGYSWTDPRGVFDGEGDWNLSSGTDPETWSKWFVIRILFEGDVMREIQSAEPAVFVSPSVLNQKIALLKIAPVGTKIDGVGWRRTETIFYVRIYEYDVPLGE